MKIENKNLFKQLKSVFPFLMAFVLIIILSIATIIEKKTSQAFVVQHFYGTVWIAVLWLLLVGTTLFQVFKSRNRSISSLLIHFAFCIIFCGAVVTWQTSQSGFLHLRQGKKTLFFLDKNCQECHTLPFQIAFEKFFEKKTLQSTTEDYILTCKIFDKTEENPVQLSINKPLEYQNYKLLLNSYDEDLCGVTLMVNYDPFGKPIVYGGFLMLIVGMLLWLISEKQLFPQEEKSAKKKATISNISLAVLFSLFTIYLLFRIIEGHRLPLANGMEATLVALWFMQLTALIFSRKHRFMIAIGWIISVGILSLFVFGKVNLEVEALQPVLRSSFLISHVLCIMFSYALFAVIFLIGLWTLISSRKLTECTLLSKKLLSPAMLLLVVGICLGSVWAANSWGAYWSWDPKEVWALITFMLYSFALHEKRLSFLQKEKNYHLFMIVAFLFVLMTFFGVNFLLGGMHSYM